MHAIGRALGRSVGTVNHQIKGNIYPILSYRRPPPGQLPRPKDSKLSELGEPHDYASKLAEARGNHFASNLSSGTT